MPIASRITILDQFLQVYAIICGFLIELQCSWAESAYTAALHGGWAAD